MAEFSKQWVMSDFSTDNGLPFLTVGATMAVTMSTSGDPIPQNATITGGLFLVRIKHTGNIVPISHYCYLGVQELEQAFVGTYGDTSTTVAKVGYSPWTSATDLGGTITFGNIAGATTFPVSNLEIFKGLNDFTLQFFQPETSSSAFQNEVSLLIVYEIPDSNTIGYYNSSTSQWEHKVPCAYYNGSWVECDPYIYQNGAWVLCSSS